jgi:hypothetical protein
MKTKKELYLLLITLVILASCNTSRSVLNSGKVTTKNQVQFGKNYTYNISSAPITESIKGSYRLGNDVSNKINDTLIITEQLDYINTSFIAYCLDPIGYTDDMFLRYGLGHRMDIGFKKSGSANTIDWAYQFLGSNKNFNESAIGGFYGSIGLKYSWQNYRFANLPMFDKLQHIFGVDVQRKDFAIPLTVSKSFGPEERTGCFSFGLIYSYSFINYKLAPKNIYIRDAANTYAPQLLEPIQSKVNYSSYGTFINVRVGKKYVFFNCGIALYYQNYGKYKLISGNQKYIRGVSIVPSYGILVNILPKQKK